MSRRGMVVVLTVVMIIGLSFPEIGQSATTPAHKVSIAVAQEPSGIDVSFDSGGATAVILQNILVQGVPFNMVKQLDNPEYDKVLAGARATMNDAKRAELIKKMVRILREDVASILIFSNVAVYGMKKNIDFVPTKFIYDLVLVKDITVK